MSTRLRIFSIWDYGWLMSSTTSKKYQPGATARAVAQNVERLRKAQNLNIPELGRRLGAIGHPMTATSITRLENGERRVDADDLMALAIVLGVNPNGLLLPDSKNDKQAMQTTGRAETDSAAVLWGWALGKNCLGMHEDPVVFRRKAMPRWLVEQQEQEQAKARDRDILGDPLLGEEERQLLRAIGFGRDNGND